MDAGMLEERLGIPVVPFTANDVKNYGGFYEALDRVLRERPVLDTGLLERKYMDTEHFPEVCRLIPENGLGDYSGLWLAAKVVEGDVPVTAKVKELLDEKDRTELDGLLSEISHGALLTGQCKFARIDCILKGPWRERKEQLPWEHLTVWLPAGGGENPWLLPSSFWGWWRPLSRPCPLWWEEVFCPQY